MRLAAAEQNLPATAADSGDAIDLLSREVQERFDAVLASAPFRIADAEERVTSMQERADAFVLDELAFALHVVRQAKYSTTLSDQRALAFAMNTRRRVARIIERKVLTRRAQPKIDRTLLELDQLLSAMFGRLSRT